MTVPSIPKPPSPPHSASPLSLSTIRLYFRRGSGGGGRTVSSSLSRVGLMTRVGRLLSRKVVRNAARRPPNTPRRACPLGGSLPSVSRLRRAGLLARPSGNVVVEEPMRLSTALLLALATALSGGCKNHSDVADGGGLAVSDALAPDQAARVLAKVGDRTI